MSNFAVITPTRHGFRASFGCRRESVLLDVSWVTFDRVGLTHWRRTRPGIERVAARIIRRLDAEDARDADRYEFAPKAAEEPESYARTCSKEGPACTSTCVACCTPR